LAAGGIDGLNNEKCQVLKGRKVILFPDLNAFDKWSKKARELSNLADFTVSELLESKASAMEKELWYDIADYVLKYDFRGFLLNVNRSYPQTTIRWINTFYWLVSCFCFALIFLFQYTDWHSWNKYFRTYSFALLIILIFSKIVLDLFVLTDDLVRFFRWLLIKISSWFHRPRPGKTVQQVISISRSDFIIRTGLLVSSIPFFSMIYGMAFNAYNYQTRKLRLILPDLPGSFDGFKIVQVSDIHTGSFLSTETLARAVNIINEQKPDVVFFTGDLVNYNQKGALLYMNILKKIEAIHGSNFNFRKS
jgi:hypothetical protein